ncbi:hypothetical protein [Mesorhizobium sp.]|uniref:hypothetical protein n=1 Tax=Mesorhizobium sp. TaxID=1871066 RepID=UPI0025DB0F08|nr:hypothetical protein [Mesorhizobium sp.]
MKYARIVDGVVDSLSLERPMIEQEPEPDWLEVEDEVFAGFLFDGQNFTPPAPDPIPISIPDRVSARQFKLQLLASDLLDEVEAWINAQPLAVKIAYDNSGDFVRTEPMMQSGFAALGFTSEQIDAFFIAAAGL